MSTGATGVNIEEPGWWAVAIAALGAFIGWRTKAAADSVKIQMLESETSAVKERLRALENGSVATASALATLSAQMEGLGRTLARIDARLDGKADK